MTKNQKLIGLFKLAPIPMKKSVKINDPYLKYSNREILKSSPVSQPDSSLKIKTKDIVIFSPVPFSSFLEYTGVHMTYPNENINIFTKKAQYEPIKIPNSTPKTTKKSHESQ